MAQNGKVTQHTAIKVRIYPTPEQAAVIEKTFECCRYLWNAMLSDEMEFYAATDIHYIPPPAKYKKSAPFLKEADSVALTAERTILQQTFQRFFNNPVRNRHPAFKSEKEQRNSYRVYCAYRKNGASNIRLKGEGIVLPKLKWVRANLYRKPLHWWKLKYATVSRTPAGEYDCSLVYQYEARDKKPELREESIIGINYSVPRLYVDSEGYSPEPPQWRKQQEERLAEMQRKLSRMQPGSKNYQEQLDRIRRLHEHIANQRNDFIHKESRRIANERDIVCVTDANLIETSKKLPLADVMESGFGRFRECLRYKMERQGKAYVAVERSAPTAKTCHVCGCINDALTLRQRVWACPNCGAKLRREENAAINIREIGLKQWEAENGIYN